MATYKQIQEYVRSQTGIFPKSSWVAHVKSDLGLPVRNAANRFSPDERRVPCPPEKRPAIVAALRHFGMIGPN
jgi:hypothetical protein